MVERFVGLDVSQRSTSICILDRGGAVVGERGVNAGVKMHRRAGEKTHHGGRQRGALYGAPRCGSISRREDLLVVRQRGRRAGVACSA